MTYNILEEPLLVTKPNDLQFISQLLHDELADIDQIEFDKINQTLKVPIQRQFHGGDEILIQENATSKIYEKSWMHTEAIIKHVKSWELVQDQGIGSYSFNHWEYADNLITIEFHQILIMLIKVEKLEIEVIDIGFNGRARIERWAGGESASGKIY